MPRVRLGTAIQENVFARLWVLKIERNMYLYLHWWNTAVLALRWKVINTQLSDMKW
jgi:hypothetical protein